jgi:hypothetical protein
MKDFNIGDSEELITVNRKRWDDIHKTIEESEERIRHLNECSTIKISVIDRYNDNRRHDYNETITIMSTELAVAELTALIDPTRRELYLAREEKANVIKYFSDSYYDIERIIKKLRWWNRRSTKRQLKTKFIEGMHFDQKQN